MDRCRSSSWWSRERLWARDAGTEARRGRACVEEKGMDGCGREEEEEKEVLEDVGKERTRVNDHGSDGDGERWWRLLQAWLGWAQGKVNWGPPPS